MYRGHSFLGFFFCLSQQLRPQSGKSDVVKGAGELGVRFTLKGSDWWKTLSGLRIEGFSSPGNVVLSYFFLI